MSNVIVAGSNRYITGPYGCSSGRHSLCWFSCQLSGVFCFLLVNNDLFAVVCLLHTEMVSLWVAQVQYVVVLAFLMLQYKPQRKYGQRVTDWWADSQSALKSLWKPISSRSCLFRTSAASTISQIHFCLVCVLNHSTRGSSWCLALTEFSIPGAAGAFLSSTPNQNVCLPLPEQLLHPSPPVPLLVLQGVPWAFLGRTVPWSASARTEPTATTSAGSARAGRASWGGTASTVSTPSLPPSFCLGTQPLPSRATSHRHRAGHRLFQTV